MQWHRSRYTLAVDQAKISADDTFKIGEPRFDSGMALLDKSKPSFNPLAPLTPEEVCWIIDRSFSCEVNQTLRAPFHMYSLVLPGA
jgi:hypothetical protein